LPLQKDLLPMVLLHGQHLISLHPTLLSAMDQGLHVKSVEGTVTKLLTVSIEWTIPSKDVTLLLT
jgi:hypothetical protein